MAKRKPLDRGVNYRRTRCRSGFGVCTCDACQVAWNSVDPLSANCPKTGTPVEGCTYLNREEVFANSWEGENAREGRQMDTLQALMATSREAKPGELSMRDPIDFFKRVHVAFRITPRERVIVATVIQWLGSTGGWCFLVEIIKRCGFAVIPREELDRLHADQERLRKIE